MLIFKFSCIELRLNTVVSLGWTYVWKYYITVGRLWESHYKSAIIKYSTCLCSKGHGHMWLFPWSLLVNRVGFALAVGAIMKRSFPQGIGCPFWLVALGQHFICYYHWLPLFTQPIKYINQAKRDGITNAGEKSRWDLAVLFLYE